eukprot:5857344-Pyramimonas_sp.AAC.1
MGAPGEGGGNLTWSLRARPGTSSARRSISASWGAAATARNNGGHAARPTRRDRGSTQRGRAPEAERGRARDETVDFLK